MTRLATLITQAGTWIFLVDNLFFVHSLPPTCVLESKVLTRETLHVLCNIFNKFARRFASQGFSVRFPFRKKKLGKCFASVGLPRARRTSPSLSTLCFSWHSGGWDAVSRSWQCFGQCQSSVCFSHSRCDFVGTEVFAMPAVFEHGRDE